GSRSPGDCRRRWTRCWWSAGGSHSPSFSPRLSSCAGRRAGAFSGPATPSASPRRKRVCATPPGANSWSPVAATIHPRERLEHEDEEDRGAHSGHEEAEPSGDADARGGPDGCRGGQAQRARVVAIDEDDAAAHEADADHDGLENADRVVAEPDLATLELLERE